VGTLAQALKANRRQLADELRPTLIETGKVRPRSSSAQVSPPVKLYPICTANQQAGSDTTCFRPCCFMYRE